MADRRGVGRMGVLAWLAVALPAFAYAGQVPGQEAAPGREPTLPAFAERAAEAVVISAHDATGVVEMRLANGVVVRARSATVDPDGAAFMLSAVFGGGPLAETAATRGFSDAAASAWASASLAARRGEGAVSSGEVRALLSRAGLTLRTRVLPGGMRVEIEGRSAGALDAAARLLGALLTRPVLDDRAIRAWAAERSVVHATAPADTSARLTLAFNGATRAPGRWWIAPPTRDAIERATEPGAVGDWLASGLGVWPLELTVVGAIDPMAAAHTLRAAAGAVSPRPAPSPESFAAQRRGRRPQGPVDVAVSASTGPTVVAIGFHGAEGSDLGDPSRLAEVRRLIVAKTVLTQRLRASLASWGTGGLSDGIVGRARLTSEVAYDPSGAGMSTGLVWAVAVAQRGAGAATASRLWGEVERLAARGPTREELDAAVSAIMASRGPDGERAWYWVRVLESAALRGLAYDTLTETEAGLRAMTPEDIAGVLRAWSAEPRRFTVVVEPER